MTEEQKRGPLDGSTSGTIGGGGPETGGPTPRPAPPETPPAHPGDAASGRLAPDAVTIAEESSRQVEGDDLDPGPSDVTPR